MVVNINDEQIKKIGFILMDVSRPLKERFRALFTLKGLGGSLALKCMNEAFKDESELLKHEVAYCMGQMQNLEAIPYLIAVLKNQQAEPIVRHEAGEALGALGDYPEIRKVLNEYINDPIPEVRDTCNLAIGRLDWLAKNSSSDKNKLSSNPYNSVDPAPPSIENDTASLKIQLLDEDIPLFGRYRAMFALRNKGDVESIKTLCLGLKCQNALFRHEIAYVLGQIQSEASKEALLENLRDPEESPMVRHECAEALGSLATSDINDELKKYLGSDQPDVVKESCVIALDYSEYNQTNEFQYANGLSQ